jgi:hypothetical protein
MHVLPARSGYYEVAVHPRGKLYRCYFNVQTGKWDAYYPADRQALTGWRGMDVESAARIEGYSPADMERLWPPYFKEAT